MRHVPSRLASNDAKTQVLFEEIGMHAVQCTVAGTEVLPRAQPQALARAAQHGQADAWHIRWAPPTGASAPLPRHAATAMPDLVAAEAWPAIGSQVFHALVATLPVPPDVAGLARQLAMSPRQLQRRLQQAGLRYSGLLAEARYRSAGWWLLQTAMPLAEVGFLSGHADQPHLTRTFKQRSGMTPPAFRNAFAAGR